MTAFPTQTQRTRQDISVQRAENPRLRAITASLRSIRHPPSGVSATPEPLRGRRYLIHRPDQAIFASDGRPLGECRLTVRFEIAKWIRLGHFQRLKIRLAPLKLVSSDSTFPNKESRFKPNGNPESDQTQGALELKPDTNLRSGYREFVDRGVVIELILHMPVSQSHIKVFEGITYPGGYLPCIVAVSRTDVAIV